MRDVPIHRDPLWWHSLRIYAPCLAACGGTFDHSAVMRSPSTLTRYSLPVVADFQICGSSPALAAEFVPAGLAALWVPEENSNEAVERIPHARMTMTHRNGFALKMFFSLSSARF